MRGWSFFCAERAVEDMLRGSLQKEDLPETLLQKCFPLGREGLLVRIRLRRGTDGMLEGTAPLSGQKERKENDDL